MSLVDVLILGRGFVGSYLAALLDSAGTSYAATTTDGRDGTLVWRFPEDPESLDFSLLPPAASVIVTFPLKTRDAVDLLVNGYCTAKGCRPKWIYLGSTRGFTEVPSTRYTVPKDSPRTQTEDRFIHQHSGYVLNLAGLWGGERSPSRWGRFYTKERLCARLGDRSLHLLHGADAARAILALTNSGDVAPGRWLVSDKSVHDILQVIIGNERIREMLGELLEEDADARRLLSAQTIQDVGLGKSAADMRIDSSHFWSQFDLEPIHMYSPDMS